MSQTFAHGEGRGAV